MEKGDGRDRPFSPGGAAYRPRPSADPAGGVPNGGEPGDGGSDDDYGVTELYEWFSAEYGWSPRFIDTTLTDEQFALYAQKGAERRKREAWAEQERIVYGVNWGMALSHDEKGRNARKWDRLRAKATGDKRPQGLSGAALEQAVFAIASIDPSLVKIQTGA